MPRVPKSSAQCARLKLLVSVEREITKKQAELDTLRQTEKKLIKQYERGKYADDIAALRAELSKHDEVKI